VKLLRLALGLATCGVLALTAVPALGGDPPFRVKASKHEDGPYLHTIQSVNVPIGDMKTLYWKVKHVSGGSLEMRFTDALTEFPNPEGLKIRWFKGPKEITEEVKGSGYEFTLPNGSRKLFRAKVRAVEDSDGACVVGQADRIEPPFSDNVGFAVNGPCV
jgi:hypothetical protein